MFIRFTGTISDLYSLCVCDANDAKRITLDDCYTNQLNQNKMLDKNVTITMETALCTVDGIILKLCRFLRCLY